MSHQSAKAPYVCEPKDQSSGRPATIIFLHGYADDAEGLPLGIAQQFQWHSKVPYIRWVLPNAPVHHEAREQAWYLPKALPNAAKPQVPGRQEEDETAPDDDEGILASCDWVDELVQAEIDRGVPADRIVVGGFSQGCAVSLVWGLVGRKRQDVAGVMALSGYFPMAQRIGELRKERDQDVGMEDEKKKWFYAHGTNDVLVPLRLFGQGLEELSKWVNKEDVDVQLYEGMGHSTDPQELRGILRFLERVLPP